MIPLGPTKFCPIVGVISGPSALTLVFIGVVGVVGVMADPISAVIGVVGDDLVLAYVVFIDPVTRDIVVIGGPSPLALGFVGVAGLLLSSFAVGGPSPLALASVVVEGHATLLRIVVVVGPL
jgi:hypothetical protein